MLAPIAEREQLRVSECKVTKKNYALQVFPRLILLKFVSVKSHVRDDVRDEVRDHVRDDFCKTLYLSAFHPPYVRDER